MPLSIGDCDGAGTCYAFGTTDASTTPTDAAQSATRHGAWSAIPVPAAPNAELTTMSCWYGGCIVMGVDNAGTFAWSVHNSTITVAHAPSGTVLSLSCFASSTCGLLTVAAGGEDEFWLTSDAGAQWSTPVRISTSPAVHLTSLSCSGPHVCVATGADGSRAVTVASADGGAHWSTPTLSPAWLTIGDLFCSPASCVALARGSAGDSEVDGDAFGNGWVAATHQPGSATVMLACGSVTECVATSDLHGADPGLDEGSATSWRPLGTRYLPDPITDLACSAVRCVVVDDSSTVTLAP